MKNAILLFLIAVILLSACGRTKIYEKHLDNERITWNRFDVKTFKVDIKDVSSKYDFYVAIRYITQVPYAFITIKSILYTPSGETRIMEHKIKLKDNDGALIGEGMGDLWDLVEPIREGFQFIEPGTCIVEISSTMSLADLPGIMQVGLIVREAR